MGECPITAYVAVRAKIKDQEKRAVYVKATGATVADHGGKLTVRAPVLETLTAADDFDRFVLIDFRDTDSARA